MSAYLYDEALISKIKNWCEKTNIQIYGPDDATKLYEVINDTKEDSGVKLPILSISRSGYEVTNFNKKPMTYDGKTMNELDENFLTSSVQLNAIPITLSYRIDVYTRYMKEADVYIRNLIFNFINYPMLEVIIPYMDANIKHNASIRISSSSIEDTSNFSYRLSPGQITRLTTHINIDDAYMWDVRVRDNITIDGDVLYIRDPNGKEFSKEPLF